MSVGKTLGQQRAEHALHAVEDLKGKEIGHYVSYVRALPANILQNGLGQALATLLSAAKLKQDDAHRRLHDQVQGWLCRDADDAPYAHKAKLLEAIVEGDERSYLHAHAEALAYLVWLKKFAVAFLDKPEGGSE